MAPSPMLVAPAALVACSVALAKTACTEPIGQWQPRKRRQVPEQHGKAVQPIKLDDGCYTLRGIGRRVLDDAWPLYALAATV